MSEKEGIGSSPQRGTNTRMRDRLQASLAGLEELRMLRDRQQSLVDDAKSMIGRNKTRRHSFQSQNSLLEYIRPEEFNSINRRNSLSVVHEIDLERQENATQNIVENWLHTTNTIQKQVQKPKFQIGSPTNSGTKSKDCSTSNSPEDSPRNCDTDAHSELDGKISEDHMIDSEPIKSEDVVDGMDVSKNCDRSETDGAQSSAADVAFEQSVAELSGYSRCSPHRRFSLDASLLAEMQRNPFTVPYGARPQDKQTSAAADETDTKEIKPTEINTTAEEKEKESKQVTKEEIPRNDSVDGSDVTPVRLRRRQSFDYSTARPEKPPVANLQRRSSFSVGVAPSPRSSYQKSYTLSGCKTKFNFPSPLHAVLMNRQKVVLSEENDCAASSSGSDTTDTFSRSSDTLYDTDSQVHDGLYNILSQDDSPAKQSKTSPQEEKASPRHETLARDASKGDLETRPTQKQQPPSESPTVSATDHRRASFDSVHMGNIRAICNNTRRASVGEVVRRRNMPPPNMTEETAPPPLKPRLQKGGHALLDKGVPSGAERSNQNCEAVQSNPSAKINNFPRSRGSVDSGMSFYGAGGNVPRSRGSINSVMSTMSSVDLPRSDTEPSGHSTPRSGTPNFPPRQPMPPGLSSVSAPHHVDKGPQVRLTKTPRDSNNNGITAEYNNELRNSDESFKFSRCGSPDSLFDRPPPIPEKRFSLRSDAADSGFMSSCMSLQTTSSGYSYKPRGSYDPKLSITSIEEGYISSQSTDSPKEKRHSHKLSNCSFISTGSSYLAEDELSDDDHHFHNHIEDKPRGTNPGVHSGETAEKPSRNVEVNCVSSVSEARRVDTHSRPTLRRGSLASSTLSDFRQILNENKKNQNKSGQVPPSGRRHSLPINALSPQSALRQKYFVCYNTDMAPIQDSSI